MSTNESPVLVRLRLLGAAVFGSEAEGAAVKLESLGPAGEAAARGLTKAKGATTAIVSPLRIAGAAASLLLGGGLFEVGKQTITFNRQMRDVDTHLGLSQRGFANLSKQVLSLAGPTAQTPVQLAQGLDVIAESGFKANAGLLILRASARASQAWVTPITTAADAVTTVLKTYGLGAGAASRVTDILSLAVKRGKLTFDDLGPSLGQILPIAAQLHIGLTQIVAGFDTVSKEGIKPSRAATGIRMALAALLKPTKTMREAFIALGVASGSDLIKKFGGVEGALGAIAGLAKKNPDLLAQIFPSRSLAIVDALTGRNRSAAFTDLRAFRDAPGETARAFAIQAKSLDLQWDRLKAGALAFATDVSNTLIPVGAKAVGFINRTIAGRGTVGQFFAGLTSGQGSTPNPLGALRAHELGEPQRVTSPSRQAGAGVANVVVKGWGMLQKAAKVVFPAVGKFITGFVKAIKPVTPFLSNVVLPLLKGLAYGFGTSLYLAFKLLTPLVSITAKALGVIGQALGPLKGPLTDIGIAFGLLFAPRILTGFAALPKIGGAFRLLGAPLRIVLGIARPLVGVIPRLAVGFSNAALKLGRFAGTLSPGFVRSAILGATNLVGGISTKIGALAGTLSGLVGPNGKLIVAARGVGTKIIGAIGDVLGSSIASDLLAAALGGAVAAALLIVAANLTGKALLPKGYDPRNVRKNDAPSSENILSNPIGTLGHLLGIHVSNPFSSFASGGTMSRAGYAVVGERGPELLHLPGGASVTPNDRAASVAHMSAAAMPPIELHIHADFGGREVKHEIHRLVFDAERGYEESR